MSFARQAALQPETPQSSDQARQKEEDASREEIGNLKSQMNQKDQEIRNLNAQVKELTAILEVNQGAGSNKNELETLRARLLTKEDQIESLQAKIKEVTVGYSYLQTLETIFSETNQDVLNSAFTAQLSLAAIKQRINEQVRATFVEKHKIEVEALQAHCVGSVEQCRDKITGLEKKMTGILNLLTDEFGVFTEQQRAAAIAPVKEKKEEQEILQGNFIALQNKLTNVPVNKKKKKNGK